MSWRHRGRMTCRSQQAKFPIQWHTGQRTLVEEWQQLQATSLRGNFVVRFLAKTCDRS
jgi:hypothetical protein